MAKINIRSPYPIYHTNTNLDSVKMELYVYTGTQGTRGAIKYTQVATAYSDKVTFEISELVRDFLDVTFAGTYVSQMVWVDYQLTETRSEVVQTPLAIESLEGFDGYGDFEDGVRPQLDTKLLQSNTFIHKKTDSPLRLPINQNATYDVIYQFEGVTTLTTNITASTDSTTRIKYVTNSGAIVAYETRVTDDGGTFESSSCLAEFLCDTDLYPVDTITVDGDILTVIAINEGKYTPYKVTFINKFGALQDLWFFKRTNKSLSTSKNTYKGNILVDGSYSISAHQNKILNKQGKESLVLNSGFVPESYNDVFEQLFLSEKVWILYSSQTLALEITASQFGFKTQLDDKLIEYTIHCEFAFNKINSVR